MWLLLNFPSDDSVERHIWVHVPSSHSEDPPSFRLHPSKPDLHAPIMIISPSGPPRRSAHLRGCSSKCFFLLSHWSKWIKKKNSSTFIRAFMSCWDTTQNPIYYQLSLRQTDGELHHFINPSPVYLLLLYYILGSVPCCRACHVFDLPNLLLWLFHIR